MKRVGLAGFVHETNTFSPIPTDFLSFTAQGEVMRGMMKGDKLLALRGKKLNHAVCGFLNALDEKAYEVVPLLHFSATPSGMVSQAAFEQIMEMILEEIKKAGELDALYFSLHGAMVIEGYQDGETEIFRRVREVVGDLPLLASLDLHGNITPEFFELADFLSGFRTYPHVDIYETGERCALAVQEILSGKKLYKTFHQIPFLMPISRMASNKEPARSLYVQLEKLDQREDVLFTSLMEGFPAADIYDCGPSLFAYAFNQKAADAAAAELFEAVNQKEADFISDLVGVEEGVNQAVELSKTADKPVILADVQDNAGAGSTSDTVWLLEALYRRNVKNAALGLMFDPSAAQAAFEAGEGAVIRIGLGGKLVPGQEPLTADYVVEKLFEGNFSGVGPMAGGKTINLGKMAQLRLEGIRIVVCSVRVQALDRSFFLQVGIDPQNVDLLVLKSSNHYRADFEPLSAAIVQIAAPGGFVEDPARVAYKNLRHGVRLGGMGKPF